MKFDRGFISPYDNLLLLFVDEKVSSGSSLLNIIEQCNTNQNPYY